jgi:hypothetical protein
MRVEFVRDKLSYITLRGLWCYITLLNILAPTGDKTDDVMVSFYEELERVFDKFPKYNMNIRIFQGQSIHGKQF